MHGAEKKKCLSIYIGREDLLFSSEVIYIIKNNLFKKNPTQKGNYQKFKFKTESKT